MTSSPPLSTSLYVYSFIHLLLSYLVWTDHLCSHAVGHTCWPASWSEFAIVQCKDVWGTWTVHLPLQSSHGLNNENSIDTWICLKEYMIWTFPSPPRSRSKHCCSSSWIHMPYRSFYAAHTAHNAPLRLMNMIGQSQSGTGKTAASILMMLSQVDYSLNKLQVHTIHNQTPLPSWWSCG